MRKLIYPILIGVFLLSLAVILSICTRQESTPAVQSYVVSRVKDGDTVVLNIDNKDVTVRLIGVNTPETDHPRKPVEPYGKEASIFLSNLLKGERVYLEYEKGTPEKDRYDRLLAYLYRVPDKLFINLEIIRQGYGHAYTKYRFKYMKLFRETERHARESGKGLWAPDAGQKPKPPAVKDDSSNKKQEEPVEIMVRVTRTGTKYHRADCRSLAKSSMSISLKEAKTRYSPCSVCNPPR